MAIEPQDYRRMTQDQRRKLRGLYAAEQNGLCHYCKSALSGQPSAEVQARPIDRRRFPPTMFDYPVHLHHNHKTGLTIGAVHARCNAVLWQYHGE